MFENLKWKRLIIKGQSEVKKFWEEIIAHAVPHASMSVLNWKETTGIPGALPQYFQYILTLVLVTDISQKQWAG